ncbi:helix-turn-helix domain-containing protein [Clostridium perfringens]|nr:helix-turn-helix domain-containing protein [Clostridium perfringens]
MENRKNRVGIEEKRKENRAKKKIKVCSIKDIKKDFTMVQNATITLLDSEAFHLYMYLLSRCMDKDYCYPSRETIVDSIGINKNKLSSAIKYLESFGLVRIEKRKLGSHFNNVYYLYGIEEVYEIIENDGIVIEKKVA